MKIYPYIIDSKKVTDYYKNLLDEKYKVVVFNKKDNADIYNYFLPTTRDYIFWTFNLTNKTEFNKIENDVKSIICAKYQTNIFEKNDTKIICFKEGICFVVTDDEKEKEKIVKNKFAEKIEKINLRSEKSYDLPSKKENLTAEDYAYIFELYKMIYIEKIHQELQKPEKFDAIRKKFMGFTQDVFNSRITDDESEAMKITKWEDDLQLDDRYVKLENQFDLLYKNSKLDESKNLLNFAIMLSVVVVIIEIINLIITTM